jgi:hypothetical protein
MSDDDSPFLSGTERIHALARDGHHRWAEIAANIEEYVDR